MLLISSHTVEPSLTNHCNNRILDRHIRGSRGLLAIQSQQSGNRQADSQQPKHG